MRNPRGTPVLPRSFTNNLLLNLPHPCAPRKVSTASVYRSSDSRSRINVLLGLALACLTRNPKPFLLLKEPPLPSIRFPEASPTVAHSCNISFVQSVHSFKRCSLLYRPLLHHQQTSLSVHPHPPPRKGVDIAFPPKSWKYLAATRLGAGA